MTAAGDERLHTLDILRGLALFGMILVHFHQRMRLEVTGFEDVIGWIVYIFVEQKAWGMFAFLFGVGFALLLRRLDRRGVSVVPLYLRRMAGLAVFGVLAEVGFGFHILLSYACWGVVLLCIRRWPTSALLVIAALSAAARPIATELSHWLGGATSTTPNPLLQAVAAAVQQPDYSALVAARWALFVSAFPPSWRTLLPDSNLTLFILGLVALRHGVFDDPRRHRRLIGLGMTFGALAWTCAWLVPQLPTFGLLQDQWLCLTYIGAVVLLLAYRPAWRERLTSFGDAGRTALTNYMFQAAVLDALASGYGWRLTLRPLAYVPAAVLLFGLEAALSRAWLQRYRFGPLEWIWRAITYRTLPPMRRT